MLSLQSQLDLAGLEGSSVTTFSMFFQVSIPDAFLLLHFSDIFTKARIWGLPWGCLWLQNATLGRGISGQVSDSLPGRVQGVPRVSFLIDFGGISSDLDGSCKDFLSRMHKISQNRCFLTPPQFIQGVWSQFVPCQTARW